MGKIWLFGDNVSTDDIIPGRRNITTNVQELAKYAFEFLRPDFNETVRLGDIIMAGENFGCGSSREHAPLAIKGSGVRYVVARSYASIFFRNCVNNGIYPLKIKGETIFKEGTTAEIDMKTFELIIENTEKHALHPLPPFLTKIIREGGLVPYLNKYGSYVIE
jgi:3-isopropylmalate dehydratase small subunit